MKVADKIQITIETPAIGEVVMEVDHLSENANSDKVIIDIPNRIWMGTDYTHLDVTHIVNRDIELFKEMNKRNDEKHQVYVDTLCLYGIKISGNYIRLQYWFHQNMDENSHRMCAGVLTHSYQRGSFIEPDVKLYPEGYSMDVAVYW